MSGVTLLPRVPQKPPAPLSTASMLSRVTLPPRFPKKSVATALGTAPEVSVSLSSLLSADNPEEVRFLPSGEPRSALAINAAPATLVASAAPEPILLASVLMLLFSVTLLVLVPLLVPVEFAASVLLSCAFCSIRLTREANLARLSSKIAPAPAAVALACASLRSMSSVVELYAPERLLVALVGLNA